jgi:hypothetical protein
MNRPGGSGTAAWGMAGALSLCWACGGAAGARGDGDAGSEAAAGSLSASMQLPVGMVASRGTYLLEGPDSFARSVALSLDGSNDVTFVVEAVPPSDGGYTISVQVTSPDGLESCTSSAQFSIAGMVTTNLVLVPHCSAPEPASAALGTLAATVDFPAGIAITLLDTTFSDPNGFILHESWSVASDSALLVALPDVPAGAGETFAVQATSADGGEFCSATSTFEVVASETTKVTLVIQCGASDASPG